MSIVVNSITKDYRRQIAVDHISFNANPGQYIWIFRSEWRREVYHHENFTCFIPQTSGKASVCGFDISENPMEGRRNIGYLPEHNPLSLICMSGKHLVLSQLSTRSSSPKTYRRGDRITGLGEEQHKKIGALSKGFRQRVGLAQAIIHNPWF